MKGKLIVIEGTDCSGKETQTNLLIDKLKNEGMSVIKLSFPNYNSPTGKMIGGPYLGKEYICDGWFPEGAPNVDPMVSSLFYAADRRYNFLQVDVKSLLDNGVNVILDRYTYSNMAHQGGKIDDREKRINMYKKLELLEFDLLELPRADIRIFLHMPYEYSLLLNKNRTEKPDQNEQDLNHIKHAEKAFLEIANLYDFKTVECVSNGCIKSIGDISEEVYSEVISNYKGFSKQLKK